ncbi:MAG: hypothetical protein HY711_01950 [Candidatus Melainabacteria bacterium]|nr:hypothetical protein [Candidatus Melainabacteria bacterium]
MNNMSNTTEDSSYKQVTIQKASLDLGSHQTQMVMGFLLILAACIVSYWRCLNIGFLLDDFLHLDYVARFVQGDCRDFLQNFWGNWAGSDVMKSYRPAVSVSFLIDYLLWGTNALGFHLTNVFLLFLCCLLVSLITLEITGLWGNRLGAGAAIWAGLLFAVYPAHPEAVSWIVGRVDLLCGVFYLGSVFSYLRFRLLKETFYFKLSLVLFLLALLSKEMAVTLPLTILAIELGLYQKNFSILKYPTRWLTFAPRFKYLGAFVLLLAVYAVFRWAILGSLVGGYSTESLEELLRSWKVFADRASLVKIFLPANEEVFVASWVLKVLSGCYMGILAVLILRLVAHTCSPRPYFVLLAMVSLMLLPTFQIWHIYPNLVGSRLFFLSSAPLCIFIALAALPAADAMPRRYAHLCTAVGLTLLLGLFGLWSNLLAANVKPWVTAGQQMSTLRLQIQEIAENIPEGKRVLLLDLPRDFSGAGMLTRPQYLEILSRPPFVSRDLSRRLLTIEPIVSGSHDYVWPEQLSNILKHPNLKQVFRWSTKDGKFLSWTHPSGTTQCSFYADSTSCDGLTYEPKEARLMSANQWNIMSDQVPCIVKYDNFLRIYPGTTGVSLFFPFPPLNPLVARLATIDLEMKSPEGCPDCLGGKAKLVWETHPATHSTSQASTTNMYSGKATLRDRYHGKYVLWLGRYRLWTLNGAIGRIGLHLEPGNYFVDLRSIVIRSDVEMVPRLYCSSSDNPYMLWLHSNSPATPLTIKYDASHLAGTHLVKLLVTTSGITFDANQEHEVSAPNPASGQSNLLTELELPGSTGTFTLDPAIYNYPGVHQARVLAFDSLGLPVGLPSEPVSFGVPRK